MLIPSLTLGNTQTLLSHSLNTFSLSHSPYFSLLNTHTLSLSLSHTLTAFRKPSLYLYFTCTLSRCNNRTTYFLTVSHTNSPMPNSIHTHLPRYLCINLSLSHLSSDSVTLSLSLSLKLSHAQINLSKRLTIAHLGTQLRFNSRNLSFTLARKLHSPSLSHRTFSCTKKERSLSLSLSLMKKRSLNISFILVFTHCM